MALTRRICWFTTITMLFLGLLQATPAKAHGDQDWIYPGINCSLRGDALRDGMSSQLGVSGFGFIENRSTNRNMPVVCPIPRGAIGKTSGIFVSIKFSTKVSSLHVADLQDEFHCELHNVNSRGDGSFASSKSTSTDLRDVISGIPNTISLDLTSSNRVPRLGSDEGGGYMLSCSLPHVRSGVKTRLIHYAVSERD